MNSRYRRGWYGESHRHYLAAKGISTKNYSAKKYRLMGFGQEDYSLSSLPDFYGNFDSKKEALAAVTSNELELVDKNKINIFEDEYVNRGKSPAWISEYEEELEETELVSGDKVEFAVVPDNFVVGGEEMFFSKLLGEGTFVRHEEGEGFVIKSNGKEVLIPEDAYLEKKGG